METIFVYHLVESPSRFNRLRDKRCAAALLHQVRGAARRQGEGLGKGERLLVRDYRKG